MLDHLQIDDAINVVNILNDSLADHGDQDVQELAAAAKQLVSHIVEQSREIERERARRLTSSTGDARLIGGGRLEEGTDCGGRRDFLERRAVHAGQMLYLLTWSGWHPVRYESNMLGKAPVLYLPLPGVQEEVVIAVPREARFIWPDKRPLAR